VRESPDSPSKSTKETAETTSGCVICETNPQVAVIGLSRIWVHAKYQKQGIATTMVDVIRSQFVFGEVVKKEHVALTQPTLAGKLFATNYFATSEFLVYTQQ